ncbi:polysaccharide export protein Wza [Vibrio sp. STUT-A11]|nr:polysaccharide export protein Wza [Vibrio sp. STUT-A11]
MIFRESAQMKSKTTLLLAIVLTTFLAGCTVVPGSDISLGDKTVIVSDASNSEVSEKINIYRLDAYSVARFRTVTNTGSQPNRTLDKKIANYEYIIGPGDILNVTVWDHPELTIPAGSYRSASEAGNWVHADGTIFYPYIGAIKVSGKTVTQIRAEIARKLNAYIERPQVDVNVAAFRSQKAYITGEVSSPGQQPITNVPLTLLDAVNNAGGLAPDADWRNVTLTRSGEEQQISLYALMQRGDLTQNRLLKAGDIIHVPRNDSQKVFVMGDVNDPKLLKIDRSGMSLTEALSSVGGINELSADATGVFVIRISKNKKERLADLYQLNIKDASALVIGTEFDLQPYDVVYVTAAPIARWNRVISLMLPTITGFNELSEGTLRVRNW